MERSTAQVESAPGNGVPGEGEQFLFTAQFPPVLALGNSIAVDFLKNSVVIPALKQAYRFPHVLAAEMARDCVPTQIVNISGYRSANVYFGSYLLHATYETFPNERTFSLQNQWNIRDCSPDLILVAYLDGCADIENSTFTYENETYACTLTDLPEYASSLRLRTYLQILASALNRSHVMSVNELELDLLTEI